MKAPHLARTGFGYIRGNYGDSPDHIVERDVLYRFPLCGSSIPDDSAYAHSPTAKAISDGTSYHVCARCLKSYDLLAQRLISLETEAQQHLTDALAKAVRAIKTYESDTFSAWGYNLIDAEAYAMAVALMTRAGEMIEETGKMTFDGTVLSAMLDEMRTSSGRSRKTVKR